MFSAGAGVNAKGAILGAGTLVLILFSASVGQAQCTGSGALAPPPPRQLSPASTVVMAVADVPSP